MTDISILGEGGSHIGDEKIDSLGAVSGVLVREAFESYVVDIDGGSLHCRYCDVEQCSHITTATQALVSAGVLAPTNWSGRAEQLQTHGNVPERRAECVALREQGLNYQEISDELGLGSRSNARSHVLAYEEDLEAARWLAEHGPDV